MKAFSETIQGTVQDYTEYPNFFGAETSSTKGPPVKRPHYVKTALEDLRTVYSGKQGMRRIGFNKKMLSQWYKYTSQLAELPETVIREEIEEFIPRGQSKSLFKAESEYIKKILKIDFKVRQEKAFTRNTTKAIGEIVKDTSLSNTEKANKVIDAMAKGSTPLKKSIAKITLRELIPKTIPIIGAGLVASSLVKRIIDLIYKEEPDEFSEHTGGFYHRDVGWY